MEAIIKLKEKGVLNIKNVIDFELIERAKVQLINYYLKYQTVIF